MAADPSAVHAIRRYGNWEVVKGRQGEFGVVRVDDGTLWEAWHRYHRDMDIRCPTVSVGGVQCNQDAGHEGHHTVWLDEI